jgi:hypothetical protein
MARKKRKQTARVAVDGGTPETRRRCTPDPLLDSSLAVHRAEAGRNIRMAIEEGLDAASLDIVRIGLGGGSSGYSGGWLPLEHLVEARGWLERWRVRCRKEGLRHDVAEAWACGMSVRQVAIAYGMNRPKAAATVELAIDLYADMRGYRRIGPQKARIAVWEPETAAAARAEAGFRRALVNHRNVRGAA